jgi:hypothetical protein
MKKTTSEKLEKKYINEISALFPLVSKQEKTYLKKMKEIIDDTLSDEAVPPPEKIEDFYSLFGEPYEIVHQYLSEMDKDTFQNILKLKKIKKTMLFSLFGIMCSLAILFSVLLIRVHLNVMETLPAYTTTEIVIIESEEDQ